MVDIETRIDRIASSSCKLLDSDYKLIIPHIAQMQFEINEVYARCLIRLVSNLFKVRAFLDGYDPRKVEAIMRKLRDAGRRSAPWKPTSSKVPGRPQDGADGNRTLRWLLPEGHKFYASEVIATLVEVKYYLQIFSMANGPDVSDYNIEQVFTPWLIENPIKKGLYVDPVQLDVIDFNNFIEEPRTLQSGHIYPLDRGGVHHPSNTFLMLFRSNQIQGNLTVNELLGLMRDIVKKHDVAMENHSALESNIREIKF
ncbi:hypothetical protein [Photobacterium leiognathi]|uniref:HNH endonuclease n=1 Tax=Photobacterium leiognathi subsp. mandapamensis TaxID=48408 RepID=A0A2T3KPE6_PHOLD|nr:hypothetical protein [Photobacterium leiognathi]PSV05929.1 hypothetical protein C0W93_21005 [Photobacterium leiognathi subsp. mandapamensis]